MLLILHKFISPALLVVTSIFFPSHNQLLIRVYCSVFIRITLPFGDLLELPHSSSSSSVLWGQIWLMPKSLPKPCLFCSFGQHYQFQLASYSARPLLSGVDMLFFLDFFYCFLWALNIWLYTGTAILPFTLSYFTFYTSVRCILIYLTSFHTYVCNIYYMCFVHYYMSYINISSP